MMKKNLFIIMTICMGFISCKSNLKKAEILIRQDMFETLYDFKSYEPISTTITEAKENPCIDTTCRGLAKFISFLTEESIREQKEALDNETYMYIWGAPTLYSSAYSDRQYFKYRRLYAQNLEMALEYLNQVNKTGVLLEEYIDTSIDTLRVIGWDNICSV